MNLAAKCCYDCAIQKGDVVPVTLFTVAVQDFSGSTFDVKMEEKQNSVKQLKLLIQEEQGTPLLSQAPFLLPKSGKPEEASEFPMTDEYLIEGACSVVISVQAPAIAWAKSGTGISITDESLVIKKEDFGYRLATGSVEIGGENGVREGYFEVEPTDSNNNFMVGIVKTGSFLFH